MRRRESLVGLLGMMSVFRRTDRTRVLFYGVGDGLLLVMSLYVAFWLRFGGEIPPSYAGQFVVVLPLFLGAGYVFLWREGLYRASWSYVRLQEMIGLGKALTYSFLALGAFLLLTRNIAPFAGFPRMVLLINYPLSVVLLSLFRLSKRIYLETWKRSNGAGWHDAEAVLVAGAGDAGEQIVWHLQHQETSYRPVALVDDDPARQGAAIHGVRVKGRTNDIPRVAGAYGVRHLFIAMPSANAAAIRRIVSRAREAGIGDIRVLPTISELLEGGVDLAQLREVQVEDLLSREAVQINPQRLQSYLEDSVVMVTGAAGSIGSELCRQIVRFGPRKVIAVDQDETGLFYLQEELAARTCCRVGIGIADITCRERMMQLLAHDTVEVVFHAAAYKHVPLMEQAPEEAVRNNIVGLQVTLDAAVANRVKRFVFISTDKAVCPVSVMGMTKRIGELLTSQMNGHSGTRCCAVRFGNVLGSRGSVVPLFAECIRKRRPITVTHPEVERYFMIPSEAALLVLEAGAMEGGGEVFVLDMGHQVKIVDLAREMITLSGLQPNRDVPIVFDKLRPGERLSEMIVAPGEVAEETAHPKIRRISVRCPWGGDYLHERLRQLSLVAETGQKKDELVGILKQLCEDSFANSMSSLVAE